MLFVWILYVCIIGAHATIRMRTIRSSKNNSTIVKTFENSTVLLPCHAESLEDHEDVQTWVIWRRDETLLVDSRQFTNLSVGVTVYSNGSLEISSVQREDSGEYVCQAIRSTPWGDVTQVYEIVVMYPPSVKMVPESGELEVNLGEMVEMECVAKGVPAPVISWEMKDHEIPLLDARPQLRFYAENRNFSDRYTCVAVNDLGSAKAHIDLRIRYKPEVHVKKPWVHASPGIRAMLDCTVIASPDAKVEWYFNNQTLKYTSRRVMFGVGNDYSLLIRNVNVTDYGSYLCRASNSLGITEKIIELAAIANPAVFKKESHSSSKTSYNFIWEIDSYIPIIEYQFWFRKYRRGAGGKWHKLYIPSGSDVISPVHTRSFNLTGLDVATHYEAVVLSRNRYGWSHPSDILLFHTEGALDLTENFETDSSREQNRISAIQLTSMSQDYHLAGDASGSLCNQAKVLPLILSMLIIKYFDYNARQ